MKPEEQFKQTVNKLNEIFRHKADVESTYGKNGYKHLKDTFAYATNQLRLVGQDKPTTTTPDNVQGINKALGMLIDVALYKPLTSLVKDMSVNLSRLIFNWNRETIKNSQINSSAQLVDRLVCAASTLQDLIYLSRKILHRMDVMNERRPEAYALSKHYLETLSTEVKSVNDRC